MIHRIVTKKKEITIGAIGYGNIIRTSLLPSIDNALITLKGVTNIHDKLAPIVTQRYGFEYYCADYGELINDPEIDTIFISAKQKYHAQWIIDSLQANKNVFCEAPLCVNKQELKKIIDLYNILNVQLSLFPQEDMNNSGSPIFMIGYNRRFSPLSKLAKKLWQGNTGPSIINYRINAGILPDNHWLLNLKQGGGRIIGEVCHFIDFISFITGSTIDRVFAHSLSGSKTVKNKDNVIATLMYNDGSVGSISYFAVGDQHFPKERIEIFGDGKTCVIDDFCKMTYSSGGKKQELNVSQDKGYRNELKAFCDTLVEGRKTPIPFTQIIETSLACFGICKSIKTGYPIFVPKMVATH